MSSGALCCSLAKTEIRQMSVVARHSNELGSGGLDDGHVHRMTASGEE